jgi:signal-transduction protein with cAMP-binding, CBS, and nucleotidyltransferase domain
MIDCLILAGSIFIVSNDMVIQLPTHTDEITAYTAAQLAPRHDEIVDLLADAGPADASPDGTTTDAAVQSSPAPVEKRAPMTRIYTNMDQGPEAGDLIDLANVPFADFKAALSSCKSAG